MADLRDDILKEEEEYGGFNPGEPDDDSFSLKDKPYPGNLFLFLNPLISKDEPNTDEDLIDSIEVDGIDNFSHDDNVINESEEDLFEFEKQKLKKKSVPKNDDELDDSELASYVSGLMAATKRKSKVSNSNNDSDETEPELRPFDPVENDAETSVVISDYELDKPSTSAIADMQFTPSEPPKPKFDTPEPAAEQKEPAPKKDNKAKVQKDNTEKKKRKFGLLPILSAVALLLIVAGISYFFIFDNALTLFSGKSIPDSLNVVNNEIVEKQDITDDAEIIKEDSIPTIDTVQIASAEKDAEKEAEESISQAIDDNEVKQIEVKPEETKPVIKAPEPVKVQPVAKKQEAVKPKATEPKTPVKIESAPKVKETIAEAKIEKKADSEALKETAISETFVPKDEPGVYIVQIYSSPSLEDAKAWLEKLKSKNVPGAFISEQNVRDKVWYRVRFGNFTTREEARVAALRYGFAQTWIDRVK